MAFLPYSGPVMHATALRLLCHAISNRGITVRPPILFGHQHSYGTHCSDCFANPYIYRISRMMKYFHGSASTWWNDTESKINFLPTFLIVNWLIV